MIGAPRGKSPGDEISPGTFYLPYDAISDRGQSGLECPSCYGYCERVESTQEEVRSDLNCGRSYACCCVAFLCKVCGKRWVGQQPSPEMNEKEIDRFDQLLFLADIIIVCKKHKLSLGHEDTQGAFLIYPYDEKYVDWLLEAQLGGK